MSTFTPAQPTDADLLSSARDGDADSFGLVFERHAAAVLRFCFRRTGNAASAEDLTSIVFLAAWEQREKTVFYEGRARPWLLGVALNVLRSQSRAERRYRDALARIPAAASPEPESDAAIAARRRAPAAAAALVVTGVALAASGVNPLDWLRSGGPNEVRFSIDPSATVHWPAPSSLRCDDSAEGESDCGRLPPPSR